MKQNDKKTRAVTLTELLVMMAVMVILLAIAAPVSKKLAQSLGGSGGTRNIINAALTSARAIAVREGQYAGVRFQQDSSGRQYLVFIIHDPDAPPSGTGYANGFRVVAGRKPTALPEGVGAMAGADYTDDGLDTAFEMNDATTFSMIFNSSGKFVIHTVWVYSADGKDTTSTDKIFNFKDYVLDGSSSTTRIALLRRDGNDATTNTDNTEGYQQEKSVPSFIIYEKKELAKKPANQRWSGYLFKLGTDYINPYTGELVRKN